jgi:hypothetical protein
LAWPIAGALTNFFPKKIKCSPYIAEPAFRLPSQRTEKQLREEKKCSYYLSFCFCYSAVAADITAIPDGAQAEVWGSSEPLS